LAAALRKKLRLRSLDGERLEAPGEQNLTDWMKSHLQFSFSSFEDRDALDNLETKVLLKLNPPLNIKKMASSGLRIRLSVLRARLLSNRSAGQTDPRAGSVRP
jgi:hypothetical protein